MLFFNFVLENGMEQNMDNKNGWELMMSEIKH